MSSNDRYTVLMKQAERKTARGTHSNLW